MEDNEQTATDDEIDTESSVRADEPKTCAHCGTQIDTTEWHPLVTRTDDDGTFRVRAFCDDGCRDEWADDDVATTGEET